MAVVSVTTQSVKNFGIRNEFVSTLLLAIVSAIAYDFLKSVVSNQIVLIVLGIALALFFGNTVIGEVGLGIAVIGIAKYVAKDTATIVSEINSS